MKLIELITNRKNIGLISKSEIPTLLGEIETLKARLWVRLTEWEEIEPVVVLTKKSNQRTPTSEFPMIGYDKNALKTQGRILRIKEVMRLTGLSRSTLWKMERRPASFAALY
jgi:hypothetical protein